MMDLITPDWPAPQNVRAYSSTRLGGFSSAPFDMLNIGDHVGDRIGDVSRNRKALCEELNLPNQPFWLEQTHSNRIEKCTHTEQVVRADGSYAPTSGQVCVVLTADCLPLLLTDKSGSQVAAVHAGWRGMSSGIIEQAVQKFSCDSASILAWAGPCIGPAAFETGLEVKAMLGGPEHAYLPHVDDSKTYVDLTELARCRLRELGVDDFYSANLCTYSNPQRFFSYRRDGQTGRMATFIWISD